MIRVLIADGQRLPREALAAVLSAEPGVQVVSQLSCGADLVASALRTRPNVALIDVDLAGLEGVSAAEHLKVAMPRCRVVIVGTPSSPAVLRSALDAGVEGFISKRTSVGMLIEIVRRVAVGARILEPQTIAAALQAPDSPLSERDSDILRLAAQGHTPHEIAEVMHLSPGTIRNNLAAIYRKVGARNRIEAIRVAAARGWI